MIIAQLHAVASNGQIKRAFAPQRCSPASPAHLQLNRLLSSRQTFSNNLKKKTKERKLYSVPAATLFDHITLSLFCPHCPADLTGCCLKVYWPMNRD